MTTGQSELEAALKALGAMVRDIRVAMLTTLCADGTLRSRPMETIPTSFDGDLWFFTDLKAPKVGEVQHDPRVNVSYAAPEHHQFVSITGTASIVQDPKRAELLWSPDYFRWFPAGLDDPDLALLRVNVEQAEYWDNPSRKMGQIGGFLQSVVGAGRSRAKEHEKISWPRPSAAEPKGLTDG